jgi:hypothetical protein
LDETSTKEQADALDELGVVVELAAVDEAASPGEDRGDGVRGGLAALLVLPTRSDQPSQTKENRSHEAQRCTCSGG